MRSAACFTNTNRSQEGTTNAMSDILVTTESLTTDHERENEEMHGLTRIFVHAKGKKGRWGVFDIAELDTDSLTAWLKHTGGDNLLAENTVRALLGHPD